jgi:hypothetical protein
MNRFYLLFMGVCIFHLVEHVIQALEVYVFNVPLHEARGVLGVFWPWLVHSETLHYGYALFMLVGLWLFRLQFGFWWKVAIAVQCWHHFEHALLLYQATIGQNFFGAPQPISVIQFLGFLNGPAETGFDGMLKMSHFGVCDCQGAKPGTIHEWSFLLMFVRRVEVHLLYNLVVMIPMFIAIGKGRRVNNEQSKQRLDG